MKYSAATQAIRRKQLSRHVVRKPKVAHTERTWYHMKRERGTQPAPHWQNAWKNEDRTTQPSLPQILTHKNHEETHNGCCFMLLFTIANWNSEEQRHIKKRIRKSLFKQDLPPTWFPPPSWDLTLLSSWFYRDTQAKEWWMQTVTFQCHTDCFRC